MTTVVAQPAESAHEPATTIGFGNVLRSEWTKLRSVRSTYWTTARGRTDDGCARRGDLRPMGARHHATTGPASSAVSTRR